MHMATIKCKRPVPTVDVLIQTYNEAKVFSKLDLRGCYYQLTLASEYHYHICHTKGLY